MSTMAAAPAKSSRWWLPLVEGILAILVGLMFLTSPAITSVSFVFGLGIYWVIVGVADLVRIFMDRTYWGWRLFNGILGILVGGLIVTGILGQNHPLGTAFVVGSAFTLLVACLTIVYGVIALIAAFRGEGWWPGVLGAIAILFGLLMLFNVWVATLALPWSMGIVLIGGGIFLIIAAFRMR
jgi:uncharacterized membrane protein HdeD (DUF308 family)